MKIKYNTLAKGVLWELLGCVILFLYTWAITGDRESALALGLVYPTFRAITWYPYDRLFKRIWRRYVRFTEVEDSECVLKPDATSHCFPCTQCSDLDRVTISGELIREARGSSVIQSHVINEVIRRIAHIPK
jgi:uncharacterized membrane protein